jgi:hypothetical protein
MIKHIIYPPAQEDTNQLNVYIDEASSTVTYFGWALPGASTSSAKFRIKKMTISGSVTTLLKADGNDDFDNVWDNRASLTYS